MLVNLQQNSPEWLKWREGGLGCSDIAIVLNEEFPWPRAKSAYQLWAEKCGHTKPPKSTAAQEHGHANEDTARLWYCQQKGIDPAALVPTCAVYDEADYIRASVDGWDGEHRHGVEIKCPKSAESWRDVREGKIPSYYWLQMLGEQEILDAATWDYCVYWAQTGEGIIIPVERNLEVWLLEVLPALQEFWQRVLDKKWPRPEGVATDDSAEWAKWAADYLEATAMIEKMKAVQGEARRYFRQHSGTYKSVSGGGINALWMEYKPRWEVKVSVYSEAQAERALTLLDNAGLKATPTPWPANLAMQIRRISE